jgi:DNA-3-methyladenine glycosylase II
MPNPEIYENGVWRRALRLKSGKIIPVKVRSIGTTDKPRLEVLILSKTGPKETSEIEKKLTWIFNTDSDLAPLYSLMDRDPILSKVKEKLYGLRTFRYSTVFEGVIKSIVQQQISLAVSWYMIAKLVKRFGDLVEVNGEEFYEFPAPKTLAKATTARLMKCGLSQKKAEYVRSFSEKVAAGSFDPESLKVLSSEEMVRKLCEFKGIGRWTAELVVVTSTDREALPADDLGARRVISNFYFGGRMVSGNELRKFAGRWGRLAEGVIYYLIYSERYDKLKNKSVSST